MSELLGLADAMMMRGSRMRNLRQLAMEDDAHRSNEEDAHSKDDIKTLPSGSKLLYYPSYLDHQNYYDDLKHANVSLICYDCDLKDQCKRPLQLIIEQDKTLGKGGLCWDAAFILGEHLIANEEKWNECNPDRLTTILELGSGTGLLGMMIAKACRCQVKITDLKCLEPLMKKNLNRNFTHGNVLGLSNDSASNEIDERFLLENFPQLKQAVGTISSRVLDWSNPSTYPEGPCDVILGADIVATLYDPVALVETMYTLSSPATILFVSGKTRLDLPHIIFEKELKMRFNSVERIPPVSSNRNPDVFILAIKQKIVKT